MIFLTQINTPTHTRGRLIPSEIYKISPEDFSIANTFLKTSKLVNERVSRVYLNLTKYNTKVISKNQRNIFVWGLIGEVNTAAGMPPCHISIQGKASSRRT
jgi:hypothetical protein